MSEYSFISSDQWKKHQVIGRGGSSTVYKVELKHNGKFLAMKEVQIDGLTKDQILAIEAEIETMKSLSDPNIVNYLGTYRHQNNFYMFLEYADGGSLRQFYQKNGRLNESQVRLCTKDMLLGLSYLHSNGIAHRDIKGANVLLTAQGEMKLADFGASKRLDTASIVSGLKGTPHWMAPEVIKGTQTSTGWMKADIWSLGCTVVEMITGSLPFSQYANPMTAMYQIAGGKSPPIAEDIPISSYAREFVSLCCAVEPNDRPSVEELLQHIFILQGEDDRESMCCQFLDKSKDERMIGSSPLSVPPLTSPPFTDGDIAQNEESINTDLDHLPPASRHLSEGQMLLQKLNRVVVIDINASSPQDSVTSSSSIHDQVTPIINQTRKRRVGSNSSTLQAVNLSRGSPLLPPTGKKTDKKNNPPKPTSPILTPSLSYTEVTSPLSVIGPIPSSDDTASTSRSRSNSSACPTPVMFSNNSEYHRRASRGGVETPSDSLMSEEKMMSSTYGSRSVSQLDLFEAPIPLSRSASLNDALFDQKEGTLRPIAPLSGQKIHLCCDVEPVEVVSKLPKKQPLQSLEKTKQDSKTVKTIAKPKSSVRSKSASSSAASNAVKILLPPMQTLPEATSSQLRSLGQTLALSQSVPELPLRLVQSAPTTFTQSMNLPPLLSVAASPKRKSVHQPLEPLVMTASCPSKLSNRTILSSSQRRPSFEEYEQEGGILAPRG